MGQLMVGDTIRCKDSNEAFLVMKDLLKEGYSTDFVFDDPESRFVLKITEKTAPCTWRADEEDGK